MSPQLDGGDAAAAERRQRTLLSGRAGRGQGDRAHARRRRRGRLRSRTTTRRRMRSTRSRSPPSVSRTRLEAAPLVLTARAENHLHGVDDLDDTIARLTAYRGAGADVVYAPGLADLGSITRVVEEVGIPVNVLALPSGPSVAELGSVGVRRSRPEARWRRLPTAHCTLGAWAPRRRNVPLQRERRPLGSAPGGLRARVHFRPVSTGTERELWGGETRKAVANFPVSGEPIPVPVARWLGRIKAAATRANADLGLLDAEKAERIAAAGCRDRPGRARRPVSDRRLPDRLRHELEHERERGHGCARRRGCPRERRRQHGPELERRLPLRGASRGAWRAQRRSAAGARPAGRLARGQGEGVRRRGQVRPHAPDGRGPGDPRPGVGGYAAQVREGIERVRDSRKRLARSCSAARPSAPA